MMKISHALLAIFMLAMSACGGGDDSNNDSSNLLTTDFKITDKFAQTGQMLDNTFVLGDDVILIATINNLDSIEKSIVHIAPLITMQILSEDETTLVFDPDFGLSFPPTTEETIIDPFGEIGRSVTWKGVDNTGMQVAPGIYQVVVEFNGIDGMSRIVYRDSILLQ